MEPILPPSSSDQNSSSFEGVPPPILPASSGRPTRRRGGGGWRWLALILAFLLLLTWGAGLLRSASVGLQGGARFRHGGVEFREVTLEDHHSNNKVLAIELQGMISGDPWDNRGRGLVASVTEQLEVAAEDGDIKAVLLRVDSPGGEVLAADDLNRAVREFQDRTGKPVVASFGSLAASGGYYVAAAARWIVAHELTLTGSIGVIMRGYNYRRLMDKVGVSPVVYKSGRFKDMLSGDREPDAEEVRMLQALVNETFGRFKEVVRTGREAAARANGEQGRPLQDGWEEYTDGRVFSGKQALEMGFVDELGSLRKAFERSRMLAGIGKANLIKLQEPVDLASFFGLFSRASHSTLKLDLGLEEPSIQAGRPYFLAPTFLH